MRVHRFEVKYYKSLDAVVFIDEDGTIYNCNNEDDVRTVRNIMGLEIIKLRHENETLRDRMKRIEDVVNERYEVW